MSQRDRQGLYGPKYYDMPVYDTYVCYTNARRNYMPAKIYFGPCLIDGCDRKVHAKGLCSVHHGKLRHNGDPMVSKRDLTLAKLYPNEYRTFRHMKKRGSDLNQKRARYLELGRDIKVSACFKGRYGFKNFINEIGTKPTQLHTIDRIDNTQGYEPGNIRWATQKEQSRNKSTNVWVTVRGETLCVTDAVKKYGQVNYVNYLRRIKRGFSVEEALFVKNHRGGVKP